MALERKARTVGESLTVTIPSQIAEFYHIYEGTLLEWQPMQNDVFKIVKHAKTCRVRKKGTNKVETILAKDGKCIAPRGFELV